MALLLLFQRGCCYAQKERRLRSVGGSYTILLISKLFYLFNYREMQLFLIGYIIIEICEIFTVGEFPLSGKVRVVCDTFEDVAVRRTKLTSLARPLPEFTLE